jgi:hypothetical protein
MPQRDIGSAAMTTVVKVTARLIAVGHEWCPRIAWIGYIAATRFSGIT